MSNGDKKAGNTPSTDVIVKPRPKTKTPSMYKVLMLNDDYTPMEFVVHVLEKFFGMNRSDATRIIRSPLLGEHTEEVLRDVLGYSGDEIARIAASGAVGELPKAAE